MTDGRILITGADGYLGRQLVRHYLTRTEQPLLLWVRAADPARALARCAAAVAPLRVPADRVRCTGGDLSADVPFAGVRTDDVTAVVHAAAVTSFAVAEEPAQRVNARGTAKLLELAGRCPRLRTVCLLSSVYATGLSAGPIAERPVDDPPGFANAYERSKWAAEACAWRRPDLPVSVLRLATVVADDATGRAGQRNAVHNTLQLLRLGLLALMPGLPDTLIYLSTAELVVQAVVAAVAGAATGVFHVTDRAVDSLTLDRTLQVALEAFEADPGFVRRRVLRPQYADLRSYQLLVDSVATFGASVLGQALVSLLPFAGQLYVAKDVRNDRLRGLLPAHRPADPVALLAATCRRLVAGDQASAAGLP